MKNLYHKLLIIALVAVLFSCKEDEEPAPHTVGVWELEATTYEGFPDAYSYNEGRIVTLSNLEIDKWTLELKKNKSFVEKVSYTSGNPSDNAEGTWESEEEILTLTYEDEDDPLEWDVVKDKTDQLWISFESSNTFMSNAIQEELVADYGSADGANAYLDDLFEQYEADPTNQDVIDELNRIFTVATFDWVFKFKRSDD
ncbi:MULTISPECIES: lipocalin family protein [Reichenbachiella]|uniref:Lipocalin-like domain-containing protein n=1 Tax=Reichenbachiella agariperforans TaxID=156994 RepID=A0A1M6KB63_REIAG|nr:MULTISPECIES: lipocalin family protein [Reichenbachiella]RJE74537.1 hypothetical protein BGP76_15435 [Reichenbachiella sp. MSK19-1]SHJ56208.1 Lipocalin-like domain-containing protein [Reichenbachiella agariperforans]